MKMSFNSIWARQIMLSIILFFVCHSISAQGDMLFESEEILEFTIETDVRHFFRERGEESTYFDATIHYGDGQKTFDFPLRVKTRGHFRKLSSNCRYPPVLLNFIKDMIPGDCIFKGQDKIKLVMPCVGDDYVIHEYLVYKLYNFITQKSFKARLVKVMFHDSEKGKDTGPLLGILLEEEGQMANRNQSESVSIENMRPRETQKGDFLKMAVFQYMIGNTDWSVQFQQNIKLISKKDSDELVAVPYDFDHAGIVRAPYAKPAPELLMESTQQRRYRGYCIDDMSEFEETFKLFNDLKDDFYAIYTENPHLSGKYRKQTLSFLDDFYETINNPDKAEKDFMYPCDPSGTGNVVIRGLRE
jgi:hypothetical protein